MTYPFDYDLHVSTIKGKNNRIVVCLHGYGSNYQIAQHVHDSNLTGSTLIGFNFPDYDLHNRPYNPLHAAFGTIKELLPVCFVLKQFVVEHDRDSIDLYARSAGGGALINTLMILNGSDYDDELKTIGIEQQDKNKILAAIQKGVVLLDVPLKSIEEIMYERGSCLEFEILTSYYKNNDLRPIDSVLKLAGLSLHILLYFEKNDEILGNRDDELYIQRLRQANSMGTTKIMIDTDGGHNGIHYVLWQAYNKAIKDCLRDESI